MVSECSGRDGSNDRGRTANIQDVFTAIEVCGPHDDVPIAGGSYRMNMIVQYEHEGT